MATVSGSNGSDAIHVRHDGTLVPHGFNDLPGATDGADDLAGNSGHDLIVAGNGNDLLNGGSGNDVLFGQAGDDRLTGGQSADYLDGGSGTDTADYGQSRGGVTVDLRVGIGHGGDAQWDVLCNIENLAGSGSADRLIGDGGANVLTGNAGDDVLYAKSGNDTLEGGDGNDKLVGGKGADQLVGGAGSDWAYYHEATSGVTASLEAGVGTGGEAVDDTFNSVENLWGSAFDDHLTGDSGANSMIGYLGNDILAGGAGDDRLAGGAGIDSLAGGGGSDALYGEYGTDNLSGGDGNDRLVGGAGADTLAGGAGSDTAYYHTSAAGVAVNLATGTGHGADAEGDQFSSIENLYGSTHDDSLTGDSGANVLLGNTGADTLTGGGGADFFVFRDVADSTVDAAGRDTITDFSHAQGDRIDLRPIDSDGQSHNGNTAFTFHAGDSFSGTGGEVIAVAGGNGVYMVLGDINGDRVADFAIDVHSATALTGADFLL